MVVVYDSLCTMKACKISRIKFKYANLFTLHFEYLVNIYMNYVNLFSIQKLKKCGLYSVTKPLARLLEPLRIATILNIYLSNGM